MLRKTIESFDLELETEQIASFIQQCVCEVLAFHFKQNTKVAGVERNGFV